MSEDIASASVGSLKLTVNLYPPDWTGGYHTLFERSRPKRQMPAFFGRNIDSFGRETDDFSYPGDVMFYRGVTISASSHIDHLLDDLSYRLAQIAPYKGRSSFQQRTEDKISSIIALAEISGPLSPYVHRFRRACSLLRSVPAFRNLMAHGHFGLTKSDGNWKIVGIRKFGNPTKSGMEFKDSSALLPFEHLGRRAAWTDQLARHLDRLHYLVCEELDLPPGLMGQRGGEPASEKE